MAAKVEIYTRPGCSYCEAVRLIFERKGADYVLHDVWAEPGKREELLASHPSALTLPQVLIDGQRIGGFEDTCILDGEGRLDHLLGRKP